MNQLEESAAEAAAEVEEVVTDSAATDMESSEEGHEGHDHGDHEGHNH